MRSVPVRGRFIFGISPVTSTVMLSRAIRVGTFHKLENLSLNAFLTISSIKNYSWPNYFWVFLGFSPTQLKFCKNDTNSLIGKPNLEIIARDVL